MARYGQRFMDRAVARLLPPESAAQEVVAREVGIGAGTQQGRREKARLEAVSYRGTERVRIPRQPGHRFHEKLDSDSTAIWTAIPEQPGQSFVVA